MIDFERFLNKETIELSPGWHVTPLYKKCPQCECDLTQYYMDSENGKRKTKEIKSWFIRLLRRFIG